MSPRVLHVIQQQSHGGASRSLVALAGRATRDLGSRHTLLSLTAPRDGTVEVARAQGIDVIAAPDADQIDRSVDEADVVQLHFWNTPELVTFMRTCDRPMRSVVWCDIAGDAAPHVITPALVDWADAFVSCCRYTADLPLLSHEADPGRRAKCHTVLGTADFDRVDDVRPAPHDGFNVGYIGTVDFVKMEPRYVQMHAAIDIPGLKCLVYGSGDGFRTLARQAIECGVADRFELGGYIHDIGAVISRLDVFGYPLADGSFAACELVLQEVMRAGVPPVIFRRGGAQRMVRHGETGFVVDTEAEYVDAIEYLYQHPDERRRMGHQAAADSRRTFDTSRSARDLRAIYDALLQRPKRHHVWPGAALHGAALFVDTLGGLHPEFRTSHRSPDTPAVLEADAAIRRSRASLCDASAGGILHYRRCFPADPHLRLWAGLAMLEMGRPALAAAEFTAAATLGLGHWRTSWYLAQAARAAGSGDLADDALRVVLAAAPDFEPARALATEGPATAS